MYFSSFNVARDLFETNIVITSSMYSYFRSSKMSRAYLDHAPETIVTMENILFIFRLQILILQRHHGVQSINVTLKRKQHWGQKFRENLLFSFWSDRRSEKADARSFVSLFEHFNFSNFSHSEYILYLYLYCRSLTIFGSVSRSRSHNLRSSVRS